MSDAVLLLSDVSYRWPGRDAFSISIPELLIKKGEKVLCLGDSGSCMSTLLSLISGFSQPKDGEIEVAGTNIAELSGAMRDRFRAEQIGVVFQQFNLLPFGRVAENILLPLRFAPERRKRAGNAIDEARRLCVALGLGQDVLYRKASGLSVGQQQRVAVARALIGQPGLIIADEPTSALDANTQAAFMDLLFSQTRSQQTSLLMVSHDERLGGQFDRVINISEIAEIGRTAA